MDIRKRQSRYGIFLAHLPLQPYVETLLQARAFREPDSAANFADLGASSLDFSIRSWTNNFGDWVKIRSDLTVRVHDALLAAGIEIPFPQQDVHLRTVTPAAGAALAGLAQAPGPRAAG